MLGTKNKEKKTEKKEREKKEKETDFICVLGLVFACYFCSRKANFCVTHTQSERELTASVLKKDPKHTRD